VAVAATEVAEEASGEVVVTVAREEAMGAKAVKSA
jgi:hypothetical protein